MLVKICLLVALRVIVTPSTSRDESQINDQSSQ
jgi:hypothetical protein